jgi:hypothetical protein
MFVDENSRIERSQHVARIQQEELRSRKDSLHQVYHSARTPGIMRPAAHPMPMQMPLIAFSEDISMAFFVNKIFVLRAHCRATFFNDRSAGGLPDTWWIHEAAKQSPKPLQALASIFFGRANAAPEMIRKAIELYGEAIVELRTDLTNGRNKQHFRIMASMTALCMYEVKHYHFYA